MGLTLKQANQSKPRPAAPAGSHMAICYSVLDLGTQKGEWKGKEKFNRKVRFSFELPDETHTFSEEKGPEPFSVHLTTNFSGSEKSTFRKLMESWTGKKLDDTFDLEDMVGRSAMVSVIHEEKDGKTYANVSGISPLPKSMAKNVPDGHNEQFYWSIENGQDGRFDNLPDFLKEMAKQCLEWQSKKPATKAEAEAEEPDADIVW